MYEMDKYTVSLLHFDNEFKDECGKEWKATGNVTVTTDNAKWGKALHTQSGGCITCTHEDFAFKNDDFTVDFWMLFNKEWSGISSFQVASSIGFVVQNEIIAIGDHTLSDYRKQLPLPKSGAFFKQNEIAHYALCRKNGTGYYFINGKLISTGDLSGAINTNIIMINGMYTNDNKFSGSDCYYEEVRISRGIARWTSDFTPPNEPSKPSIDSPTNLTTTAGDAKVTLSWTAVTGATSYNVKRSTTAGGPYTTVGANVSGTTYIDATAVNGTTYYYVVTALTADGESSNSNEASATPKAGSVTPPTPTGNNLLRVTMIDSSEREYRLSSAEVDGFVNWYNIHKSTDAMSYALNDIVDSSKEYLAFEKIISFKVIPLG